MVPRTLSPRVATRGLESGALSRLLQRHMLISQSPLKDVIGKMLLSLNTEREPCLVLALYGKASEIGPCVSHSPPELSEINRVGLTGTSPLAPAMPELLFLPLFPAPLPDLSPPSTPLSAFSPYTQRVSCIFLSLGTSLPVYLELCPRAPPKIFS